MLHLSRYQWTVLFVTWLGWGFDIFDGVLFNLVAPNCLPVLLGLTIGSSAAKAATLFWTGLLTAILLVGWAIGGIIFGQVADRIGRTKTLILTMLLYTLGTACCAFAPNIWFLILCRAVASLGIGGEWAAGASMIAEVMPEKNRVESAVIMSTSGSAGIYLATFVNYLIAGVIIPNPEISWRYVYLSGLVPAAIAIVLRFSIKEPERWQKIALKSVSPKLTELFNRQNLPLTRSGFLMTLTALITGASCSVFIPIISTGLAQTVAKTDGLNAIATSSLIEQWKTLGLNSYNSGGLVGTLLTIPAAKYWGRKKMFALYFIFASVSFFVTFGLPLPPQVRLYLYFAIGLTVYGVFGGFTYYLPELFPTRLRATGAGFCYNAGRIVSAIGPLLVGLASGGENAFNRAVTTQFWVGFIPLLGLVFMPWVIETKGRVLED